MRRLGGLALIVGLLTAGLAVWSYLGPGPSSRPVDVVLPKVRRARQLVRDGEHRVWVQVDGGVDADTIGRCAEAGADVFVAGSAVYGAGDAAAAVRSLREAAELATQSSWWVS